MRQPATTNARQTAACLASPVHYATRFAMQQDILSLIRLLVGSVGTMYQFLVQWCVGEPPVAACSLPCYRAPALACYAPLAGARFVLQEVWSSLRPEGEGGPLAPSAHTVAEKGGPLAPPPPTQTRGKRMADFQTVKSY